MDYGMSWDEGIEWYTGWVNTKFIVDVFHLHNIVCPDGCLFDTVQELRYYKDNVYSSWFHLLACGIGRIFHIEGFYHQILLRHFMTFSLFFVGCVFLYRTILLLFKNHLIALLCCVLFMLQPRFFAEQFYNLKDINFLSIVSIASYYVLNLLIYPDKNKAAIAGLVSGLAVATRVLGVLIVAEVLVLLLVDRLYGLSNSKHNYKHMLIFFLTTFCSMVLSWPYLWMNPTGNFTEAFTRMSNFPWSGTVLLNGELIMANQLPWHYLLTWISITVPELILILLIASIVLFMIKVIRWKSLREKYLTLRLPMYFFGIFLVPIIMVITLNSVVYDGWRHVYFIMIGGFLAIAWLLNQTILLASSKMEKSIWIILPLVAVVCFSAFLSLRRIVLIHPYQNTYFNQLAPKDIRKYYEIDYWGLSYRKGLEYICAHDHRDTLIIALKGDSTHLNFVNPIFLNKLKWTEDLTKADYYLSTYRGHRDNYSEYRKKEIYSIRVGDEKILSVFKLK